MTYYSSQTAILFVSTSPEDHQTAFVPVHLYPATFASSAACSARAAEDRSYRSTVGPGRVRRHKMQILRGHPKMHCVASNATCDYYPASSALSPLVSVYLDP